MRVESGWRHYTIDGAAKQGRGQRAAGREYSWTCKMFMNPRNTTWPAIVPTARGGGRTSSREEHIVHQNHVALLGFNTL